MHVCAPADVEYMLRLVYKQKNAHILTMFLLLFGVWEHFSYIAVYGGSERS